MGRRYTDEEKARVRVVLASNEGNVYKTAQDTGILRETIQLWKKKWEKDGVPEVIEKLTGEIVDSYVFDAERVRNITIIELEKRVRAGEISTKELIIAFGVLEDKITRAKGLNRNVKTVIHEMPDVRALGESLGKFLQEAIEAAKERHQDIIEVNADVAVQKALSEKN